MHNMWSNDKRIIGIAKLSQNRSELYFRDGRIFLRLGLVFCVSLVNYSNEINVGSIVSGRSFVLWVVAVNPVVGCGVV